MSERATVLVLGRRKTDNMPSLTRMLEITRPEQQIGMDASVATAQDSVRITGAGVTQPMMGKCWVCGATISSGTVCDSCNEGPEVARANTIYPVMADPGEDECVWGCEEVDESDPEN